jgi:hypothetical protein
VAKSSPVDATKMGATSKKKVLAWKGLEKETPGRETAVERMLGTQHNAKRTNKEPALGTEKAKMEQTL